MLFTGGLVSRKDKHNLYYLLPGMGKGARKRFIRNMIVAVLVGLLLSAGIWAIAYYSSR
jgi:Tfp pilus assembly protein PilN